MNKQSNHFKSKQIKMNFKKHFYSDYKNYTYIVFALLILKKIGKNKGKWGRQSKAPSNQHCKD